MGAHPLPEIELIQLARYLHRGLSYQQIAQKIQMSKEGVKSRVNILCRHFGETNKDQALQRAKALGWLTDSDTLLLGIADLCRQGRASKITAENFLVAFDNVISKRYLHLDNYERLMKYRAIVLEAYSVDQKTA